VKRGNPAQIVNACIGNAPFWPTVRKFALHRNMRLEAAIGRARVRMSRFNEWQMQIGNGVDDQGLPSDNVDIPDELMERAKRWRGLRVLVNRWRCIKSLFISFHQPKKYSKLNRCFIKVIVWVFRDPLPKLSWTRIE
jgi:hypothetical protein